MDSHQEQEKEQASSENKKYTLVWSDEFDYTGLPDPARWSYDTAGTIKVLATHLQDWYQKKKVTGNMGE